MGGSRPKYSAVELEYRQVRAFREFKCVNAFVSIIRGSLVYDRSAHAAHCSVYKPEAIFKGGSFIVKCCGVDI